MVGAGLMARPLVTLFLRRVYVSLVFFFSSRRRHTRFDCDWSSDVCSSDLSAGCPWGVAYSLPRECCHASETRRRSRRRHPRLLHAARVVRGPLPASPFVP